MDDKPKTRQEVFIFTAEELEDIKKEALKILKILPQEPKTAVFVTAFVLQHLEKSMGIKIGDIKLG